MTSGQCFVQIRARQFHSYDGERWGRPLPPHNTRGLDGVVVAAQIAGLDHDSPHLSYRR